MKIEPGTEIGQLTILERSGTYTSPGGYTKPVWKCLCTCGTTKEIVSSSLQNGDTVSCGCKRSNSRGYASYTTVHTKISNKRGSASSNLCQLGCGSTATGWAYDHSDPEEVTGLNRDRLVWYSLDIMHYRPLCSRCHYRFDRQTARRPFPESAVSSRINYLENLIKELRP